MGARRNITHLIEHLHLYLSVRCTDTAWWAHDIWDLRADPRIPQREHEPGHDQSVKIGAIQPVWLREGVRFWLRTALDAELLRWSSAVERARDMARHFGVFVTEHGYTDPALADDRAQLRLIFTAFSEYLRSPAAAASPDKPLTPAAIDATQSQTQVFYTFMVDHASEAAAATADPRWTKLTAAPTRLWGPAFRTRRANRHRELTWYSTAELQQMLGYLDVLAADRGMPVPMTHPDGTVSVIKGLGDPQAARIWLLQALTGRRASEILMLDYQPLQPIPGAERPTESDDPDGFVAKLRYQQTKVDGVVPTILVEQAVVNVIITQQRWLADTYPHLQPEVLVHRDQAEPGRATAPPLCQLSRVVDQARQAARIDRCGGKSVAVQPNPSAAPHQSDRVAQRWGADSCGAALSRARLTGDDAAVCRHPAATAEAEFLKHKKIGAHGVDIAISPADILDMTQLSARTDRVLPNGVCLLPPLKSCDKGNACLSCGHFATDITHAGELRDQRARTTALIELRRNQYRQRTGRELTDDNVWIRERLRELNSLDAILERLATDEAAPNETITGAGTAKRLPLQVIATRGAHDSALRKADPRTQA